MVRLEERKSERVTLADFVGALVNDCRRKVGT